MKLDPQTGLKRCSKCKVHLVAEQFSPAPSQPDGLGNTCKGCSAAYQRARRQTQGDHVREVAVSWMRANAERMQEAQRAHNSASYQRHKETRLAASRAYYEAHRDEMIARATEYHRQHPEIGRKNGLERRSRKMSAPRDGSVTIKALNELLATWTGVCPFCQQEGDPTIDHIIALASGGTHMMSNLQLMCRSCNSSKGART